jgi:hypothetical protein
VEAQRKHSRPPQTSALETGIELGNLLTGCLLAVFHHMPRCSVGCQTLSTITVLQTLVKSHSAAENKAPVKNTKCLALVGFKAQEKKNHFELIL